MRFLFRQLTIDQSIRRFAFEASEGLLDGAELKRRGGLLAEPCSVSRNDNFAMAREAGWLNLFNQSTGNPFGPIAPYGFNPPARHATSPIPLWLESLPRESR